MQLSIKAAARADILRHYAYYLENASEAVADRYLQHLEISIEQIRAMPAISLGRTVGKASYLKLNDSVRRVPRCWELTEAQGGLLIGVIIVAAVLSQTGLCACVTSEETRCGVCGYAELRSSVIG